MSKHPYKKVHHEKLKKIISNNLLKVIGIIGITVIVISALITTAVVTVLAVDTVAVIDTAAVIAGISSVSILAGGIDVR